MTVFMDQGHLAYDYNMFIIERTVAKSEAKIPAGKHTIEVTETIPTPGASANVALKLDGKDFVKTTVKRTVPAAFTASETFDVGADLGSPVSPDYARRAPFRFDGKIETVKVELQ